MIGYYSSVISSETFHNYANIPSYPLSIFGRTTPQNYENIHFQTLICLYRFQRGSRSATSYNVFEVKQMIVFLGNMVNNPIDIEVSRLVIGFLKFCIVQTSAVPLHHTQFCVAYNTPTCRKLLYECMYLSAKT